MTISGFRHHCLWEMVVSEFEVLGCWHHPPSCHRLHYIHLWSLSSNCLFCLHASGTRPVSCVCGERLGHSLHTYRPAKSGTLKSLVMAVNQLSLILSRTPSDVDKARLLAAVAAHSGDWLRTTRSFDRSEAVRWSHQCCGSTSSWLQSLQAARRTQCACGKDVDVKNVQISALFLTTFDFDRECLPNRSTFRKSKKTWSPKLTFHSDLRRRAASRRALPYTSSFFKVHFCPPLFMNCHRWNKGNLGLLRL